MRTYAWFLLVLIVFPTFSGREIILIFRRHQLHRKVERQIKATLPDEELIAFTFSPSETDADTPEWERDDEFRYKGKMYDVVRSEPAGGDSTRYYCLADEDEDRLFENHKQLDKKEHKEFPQRRRRVLQTLSPYCYSNTSPAIPLADSRAPKSEIPYRLFIEDRYLTPDSPPPWG